MGKRSRLGDASDVGTAPHVVRQTDQRPRSPGEAEASSDIPQHWGHHGVMFLDELTEFRRATVEGSLESRGGQLPQGFLPTSFQLATKAGPRRGGLDSP
jgi:hypothetical protein